MRSLDVMLAATLLCSGALAGGKTPKKEGKQPAAHVRCSGINECKGKGACGGATTSCAGTNECKGQGWVLVSEKECKEKKGTVLQ